MIEIAAYVSAATVLLALVSAFPGQFQRHARTAAGAGVLLVAACLIGDVLT